MINELLYCVVMTDRSETPGAAAELLSAFDYQISSWKDEETKEIRHTLYFLTDDEGKAGLDFVRKNCASWKEFGVVVDDIQYTTLKKEDWAESWKIHFKVMEVSDRLAIRPSWEKFQAKPGQVVLVLDPGMSFGTGQHATTKFCLSALDRFSRDAAGPLSLLDAGAGSGILSIAAYKLGYRPVAAFDIDPDTIGIARENAQKNGIPDADYPVETASLEGYRESTQYDVVAANILSSALIAGKRKLISMVKPGGKLILAGILDSEYEKVRKEFEEIGCVQLFSAQEKEWRGGAFDVK